MSQSKIDVEASVSHRLGIAGGNETNHEGVSSGNSEGEVLQGARSHVSLEGLENSVGLLVDEFDIICSILEFEDLRMSSDHVVGSIDCTRTHTELTGEASSIISDNMATRNSRELN